MSRSTLHTLLMTSAFLASMALPQAAQAATVMADGQLGTLTPTTGTDGTSGASATNGSTGETAATYGAAGIDATANTSVAGAQGGAGGSDNDGDATGTANGGNAGTGGDGIDFNAQATPTLTINSGVSVSGGAGGTGGSVSANNGNGGDGGNGGTGVSATSDNGSITISGTGAITGGNGGNGGTGSGTGHNGNGGNGGTGLYTDATTNILFATTGTISGGTGGTGAVIGSHGDGITMAGTGKTLTISGTGGTISGGNSGSGTALHVTGTGNTISNAATLGGDSHAGDAIKLDADGATTIGNSGTLATSTGNAINVTAGDTLTTLTNTGNIRATGATGVAINIAGDAGTITNTGGTITSANTSSTASGTMIVGADLGGMTLTGGTVSNTASGNAVTVTADQTGAIASSATITSAGHAVHFENAAGTFTNSGTVTGSITSSADNKAQTVTNTGTITGAISLDDGNDVLNANGGTITGTVSMGAGNDTVTYGNASSATGLAGAVDFGTGTNTLTINESMTTGGAITTTAASTTNATVAAGKTFTAQHDVDLADGTLANNGSVAIGAGKTVRADADSVGAAGSYTFHILTATSATGAGASNGVLDLSGGAAQSGIDAASDVKLAIDSGAVLSDGANIRVVHGGAAETTDFTGTALNDTSYLYDFLIYNGNDGAVTYTGATANDIIVAVDRVGGAASSDPLVRAIDPVLNTIGTSGDASFDAVQGNAGAATTEAAYNNVVRSLAPETNNAASQAAVQSNTLATNVINTRLGFVRDQASGSEEKSSSVWVQGLGNKAKQGMRDGNAGYDADTAGVAIGADSKILDGDTTLGIAASYAKSNVDGKDLNTTNTDVKTYQLMVYGDHSFGQGTFVEGTASYGIGRIDSQRHDVGGVSGLNARASYDADIYSARAAIGQTIPVMGATLTPKVYAEYVVFSPDNYTETGAGSANLSVNQDDSKRTNLGGEVELAKAYVMYDGSVLRPSVNVGYKHNTSTDAVNSTTSFAAGGGSFVVNGAKPEDDIFTAGLALDFYSSDFLQMTFGYGYEHSDTYDAHTGTVRASYRF